MAINYAPSELYRITTNLRTATFTANVVLSVALGVNGSTGFLFAAERFSGYARLYRYTIGSVPSTNSTPTCWFITGSQPNSLHFHYNGSNSYLFSADSGGSTVSFHRFDADSISSDKNSVDATFAAGSPSSVHFVENGSNSFLVVGDSGNSRVRLFRFDPTTVSGTNIAPTATFVTGSRAYGSSDVKFVLNGSEAYIISANQNAGTCTFYRISSPTTFSSTDVAATATFTVSNASSCDFLLNGSNSVLAVSNAFGKSVDVFRLNPTTVSGSISSTTATFAAGNQISSVVLHSNGYLFAANYTDATVDYYKSNFSTVSSSQTNRAGQFQVGSGCNQVAFALNGASSLLATADYDSNICSLYRTDLNSRNPNIALTSVLGVSDTSPIRKVSGGTLTLYSAVDYFLASYLMRSGAALAESGLGTLVYGYQISTTDDTALTINEDFVYSGATAEITGNYRVTMGASKSLTLGSKGTYYDSITIPSTGTLVITANTTITSEFVLSAGTTVAKSGAGPYTLTIPYADPGLVLGSGVVLSAPTINFTAANINNNGFDNVRCRTGWYKRVAFTTTEVNTATNKITLAGISGKVTQNTVIRLAGTDLPAPLEADQVFYPYSISGNSISLSSTPGGAGSEIDLTDVGSGSMIAIVVTELNTQLVTSGGYSFDLNTASSSAGITLASGDTLLFQAIHWKGSLQSVSPAVASKYHEEFLQYSGGNVSTLADLDAYSEHDTFAIQQDIDGYEISQLTVTGSSPTRYQWRVDASAPGRVQIESEDPDRVISTTWAVLYFSYMQWTLSGLRLFRGQIEAENLNSVVIKSPEAGIDADLTVESFPVGIPLLVNGPGMYRSDGKTWIATGSPIQHQPDALVAVPIEVEVPVNLSSEVMQLLHSIAAGTAISANKSSDIDRIKKLLQNNHKINYSNNTLTIYDDNGTTPFIVYDLKDKDGNPAYEKVFERRKQ